jgi:hypothetical protein
MSLVVVVMGLFGTGVTTASAGTAKGSSIGVGSSFVVTYNVSALLTAGGSGTYTGQITLDSDGTWYGDVLADSSLNSGNVATNPAHGCRQARFLPFPIGCVVNSAPPG